MNSSKHKSHWKAYGFALLVAAASASIAVSTALAHEGHSHAPASAKALKNPLKGTEADLASGGTPYQRNCASCHGTDGKAHTEAALKMKVKPADLTDHAVHGLTDGEIYWVITNGIKTSGMPGCEAKTSERERWQMTIYTRQLREAAVKH